MFRTILNAAAGLIGLGTNQVVLDRTSGALHYRHASGTTKASPAGPREMVLALSSTSGYSLRHNTTGATLASGTATVVSAGVYEIPWSDALGEVLFATTGVGTTSGAYLPYGWEAKVQTEYAYPAGWTKLVIRVFNASGVATTLDGSKGVYARLLFAP